MPRYNPLRSKYMAFPRADVEKMMQEAVLAQQALLTGKKIATASYVQGDGSRAVSYAGMDMASLKAEIEEMKAFLYALARQGPMRVIF